MKDRQYTRASVFICQTTDRFGQQLAYLHFALISTSSPDERHGSTTLSIHTILLYAIWHVVCRNIRLLKIAVYKLVTQTGM